MQRRPRRFPARGGMWQQQAALPQESRHPHRTSFILVLCVLHVAVSALRPGKCALAPLATRLPPPAAGAHSYGRPQGPACVLSWPAQRSTCAAGLVACYAVVLPHTRTGGRWSTARQLWLAVLVRHATTLTVAGTVVASYRLRVGACVCRAHAGAQLEKATVHPHR